MTYYETDNGGKGEMVAESITVGIGCDDDNGDYVGLRQSPCDCEGGDSQPRSLGRSLWLWARSVVVFIFLVSLAAVFFTWVGPFFMNKVRVYV